MYIWIQPILAKTNYKTDAKYVIVGRVYIYLLISVMVVNCRTGKWA